MKERRLIRDIGTVLVAQLAQTTKDSLTKSAGGLSGDDSGLANVWEELCVQVQGEESPFWCSYVDFVDDAIRAALANLPLPLQQAVSLTTDVGDEWMDAPDDGVVPRFEDEMVSLVRAAVLRIAADYESSAIERFKYGLEYEEEEYEEDEDEETDIRYEGEDSEVDKEEGIS